MKDVLLLEKNLNSVVDLYNKNKTKLEINIAKIEKIKKFFLKPKKFILGSTGIILFKPNIIVLIPFYLQMISTYKLKNL